MENANRTLKYLGRTLPRPERYLYAKLGNELTLIGTKRCNLNCDHCYDKANLSTICENELTTKELKNLIKFLKELGVNRVRLTGGEITLRSDFFEILEYCKDLKITLCTNGKNLKQLLPRIKQIDLRDFSIHLSIDGLTSHNEIRKGSRYEDLLELIRYIREEYGYFVSVNTIMMDQNIKEIPRMYQLLLDSGTNFWSISFPRLVEHALKRNFKLPTLADINDSFKKLLGVHNHSQKKLDFSFSYFYKHEFFKEGYSVPDKTNETHPCMPNASGSKGLIVDSFGNIVDCLVIKPFLDRPINIKKLLRDDLDERVLSERLYSSLGSDFYKVSLKGKHCENCRYLKLCSGGCPANSYYLRGNLHKEDVLSCKLFLNFEENIIPLLNEREKKFYGELIDKNKNKNEITTIINLNKSVLENLNFV